MFLKRYIPIGIVAFFGSLTLFGWFIDNESVEAFVNDDATQWYDIIASFAIYSVLAISAHTYIDVDRIWNTCNHVTICC